ncbi:hypothetical protein [Natrononativus amylolyticus]|uniref:hypothetical protein n=1 Tax=Natrononativus amylolyticus TaxID=2963434 RepID=UPI0020CE1E2D|nr:hypothetical protein [Natrononativus amylolyticus]
MSNRNDTTDDAQSSDRTGGLPLSRRGMLAASAVGLGIAGAGSAAADDREGSENSPFAPRDHDHGGDVLGASEPVAAITTEHLSVEGTNRVDVVGDPEIDHEGDLAAEIQSYLADREPNHLFVLPAGTYSWNSQLELSGFEFFGVVGAPQATLAVETHDPDYAFDLEGERVLLGDFTVDITAGDTIDAGIVFAGIERRGLIENLDLRGERDYHQSDRGGKFTCRVDTLEEDGYTEIRNVRLPDGEVEGDGGSVIPFAADPPHVGTNVWNGCYVKDWTSGFYVMNNDGRNILQGCLTIDCNNFGIRLGRNDVCRDSRIVLSDASDRDTPGMGLTIFGGSPLVENVQIEAPDIWNNALWVGGQATGGTVRDVDIYIGEISPVHAIDISGGLSLEEELLFENVTIVDESDGSAHPVHGAGFDYSVEVGTPNVTFRDCRFESPNRDGMRVVGAASDAGVTIENCTFDTGGADLRFTVEDAGHSVCNNRFNGDVAWDEPLSEVLWMGNRHEGAVESGGTEDWNALANWGFDVDA